MNKFENLSLIDDETGNMITFPKNSALRSFAETYLPCVPLDNFPINLFERSQMQPLFVPEIFNF